LLPLSGWVAEVGMLLMYLATAACSFVAYAAAAHTRAGPRTNRLGLAALERRGCGEPGTLCTNLAIGVHRSGTLPRNTLAPKASIGQPPGAIFVTPPGSRTRLAPSRIPDLSQVITAGALTGTRGVAAVQSVERRPAESG
ncbi:hypothetical protein, partial [Nocardia beijingensis]